MTRPWLGDVRIPPGRSIVSFTGVFISDALYRLSGHSPVRYLWAALMNAWAEFDEKAQIGVIDFGEDDDDA